MKLNKPKGNTMKVTKIGIWVVARDAELSRALRAGSAAIESLQATNKSLQAKVERLTLNLALAEVDLADMAAAYQASYRIAPPVAQPAGGAPVNNADLLLRSCLTEAGVKLYLNGERIPMHPDDLDSLIFEARRSTPDGPLNAGSERGVEYMMEAISCYASEWSLVGNPRFDNGSMLGQAESTQRRIRQMLEADALRIHAASCAIEDTARMDFLEAAAEDGCVTMCFEMDGGVHVTLDPAGGEQQASRNVETIRAGIDTLRADRAAPQTAVQGVVGEGAAS